MKGIWVVLLAVIATGAVAQEAKPVAVSQQAENAILKAEHVHDQAVDQQIQTQSKQTALESQYAQIKQSLGKDAETAAAAVKESSAKVDAAIEAAWKESGLDKSKYDFDAADFVFKAKKTATTTKPATDGNPTGPPK